MFDQCSSERGSGGLQRVLVRAIVLAAAFFGATAFAANDLASRIDGVVASGKKGEVMAGIRVVELPSGQVLYALNANRAFIPASNMKLLTTAAAIDLLGVDFTYKTLLVQRGNDLIVIGSGDPGAGDPRFALQRNEAVTAMFHRWAEAMGKAGIKEVTGEILFDDSIFDSTWINPSWRTAELDSWFAAPVGGLNFNDNCIDMIIEPTKPGEACNVVMTPRTQTVQIVNNCRTGGKGKPVCGRKAGEDVIQINGGCVKKTTLSPVAVHDPGMLFAGAFREVLVASGIKVSQKIRRVRVRQADGSLPADCKVLAVYETKLPDVLTRCNKFSQNLFAECLLKTIGYYHGRTPGDAAAVGSWTTGRVAIRQYMMKVGLQPHECVIDDGSGLSHDNRLSPTHLTTVLQNMYNHPARDIFIQSLAVGGKDGTIKKRMTKLEGQVYAKTGYVAGSRTLSGYVSDRTGKKWACFSILFNNIKGGTTPYVTIQDEVVKLIAQFVEGRIPAGKP